MTESRFREAIKASVRGLWMGVLYRSQFMEVMQGAIERELWNAWIEGMSTCGMTTADMEPEDRDTVQNEIYKQLFFLGPFADDIIASSKATGKPLEPLLSRAEMWINQYESVKSLAKVTVCGDTKYEWVMGETEEHCASCLRLNGIVKRASVWKKAGISPQQPPNPMLECEGWKCLCELKPTSKPCTPGPLPNLP